MPWYVDTRVIYYRKDLAAKAGYTTFPTNWDDFKAMAKAMQTRPARSGASSSAGRRIRLLPVACCRSPGRRGRADRRSGQTKWTLDTPEMGQGDDLLPELLHRRHRQPGPQHRGGRGGVGIRRRLHPHDDLPARTRSARSTKAGGAGFADKYAVGSLVPKDKSATSFVGGSDLVVFKNSKNRDAAWKLRAVALPARRPGQVVQGDR